MRRPKLGQHMLIDEKVIDYEINMARIDGRVILEIGGGTGNLTQKLAERAKKVTTIEVDPILVSVLEEKFKNNKGITILQEDFLKLKPRPVDVIIGNIPYYISSPILFKLIEWKFDHALLCFQKEFAQRMVANPGTKEYSRLSVMTQLYFKPILLKTISKGSFRPVPKVDSAIVLLYPKGTKIDKKRDELIRMLFVHKNKTISAALKSREFRVSNISVPDEIFNKRPFQLSIKEILKIKSNNL